MRTALLFLTCLPLLAGAAEPSDLDAVLQGFETPAEQPALEQVLDGFDSPPPAAEGAQPSAPPSPWQLTGSIAASGSYAYAHRAPTAGATDYRGLSRLRGNLALQLDLDLASHWQARVGGHAFHDFAYALNGRSQYRQQTLDELENEVELGEVYLQGRLSRQVDLKLGRQIVVWGKSDNLRITDVLNPMDMREPGLVDIEDLRLPVTMAKLDAYQGAWNLSVMAIPEIRFNKTAPYGSDYYPNPAAPLAENTPTDGGANTEYAVAVNGVFSGWDLSLYGAGLFDDQSYRDNSAATPSLRHARIAMFGAAANIALGNWLLKGEAAHFNGLRYASLPGQTKSRSDLLLGLEYSGLTDATLSLEIADRHIHHYDGAMAADGAERDQWQSALRYQGDFMHARLHLTALALRYGKDARDGGFTRLSLGYDLADALNLSGGVIAYHRGKVRPFNAIGDNDRLFAEVKYSF